MVKFTEDQYIPFQLGKRRFLVSPANESNRIFFIKLNKSKKKNECELIIEQ